MVGVDRCLEPPEPREGIRAFVEKRKPVSSGRRERAPTEVGVFSE